MSRRRSTRRPRPGPTRPSPRPAPAVDVDVAAADPPPQRTVAPPPPLPPYAQRFRSQGRLRTPRTRSGSLPRVVAAQQKARMLTAMATIGIVSYACRAAGVNQRTHEDWLHRYPQYAEDFARAKEASTDVLEAEARRRAVTGVSRPVIYKGEQVRLASGDLLYETEYSDTLLIALLGAKRPEEFRQSRFELSGPGGGPVALSLEHAMIIGDQRRTRALPTAAPAARPDPAIDR